ncbi:MAG: hypothetical protein VW338_04485 [Rhodospirillaceae bacterium]
MGGGGNALASGRIYLTGGVCVTKGSAIHGDLDTRLFELLRDLRTDGGGKDRRVKVSAGSRPSSAKTTGPNERYPATLGAKQLCARALSKDKSSTWAETSDAGKFIDEAKRRGFDPVRCEKLVGVGTTGSLEGDDNTYYLCLLPDGIHRYISKRSCVRQGGKVQS